MPLITQTFSSRTDRRKKTNRNQLTQFPCTTLVLLNLFDGLFSRTTWVNRYRENNNNVDLNKARGDGALGWQWHQLDHMQTICTSLQRDNNHTNTPSLNFYRLDAGRPTNSVKTLKAVKAIVKVNQYLSTAPCHKLI